MYIENSGIDVKSYDAVNIILCRKNTTVLDPYVPTNPLPRYSSKSGEILVKQPQLGWHPTLVQILLQEM